MTDLLENEIHELSQRRSLSGARMKAAMEAIVSGAAGDAEIERFLVALRDKGESAEEITAAAAVMRDHAVRLSKSYADLLDTCGTGGDGQMTLNVSTLSALVAAAAGVRVAKHGNRSVSGVCGSADLLEALGVPIDLSVPSLERALESTGFAFFFAPAFHPATRFAMPARKRIRTKTIFNLLGPLANPAGLSYQVLGVYAEELLPKMADALIGAGIRRALVVYGRDGLDEITIGGESALVEIEHGRKAERVVRPEDFGLRCASAATLRCETKEESFERAQRVLDGDEGPALDAVVLNAGAALYVAGKSRSIAEGVGMAKTILRNGSVRKKYRQIVSFCEGLERRS